jgi:hypothetical protein
MTLDLSLIEHPQVQNAPPPIGCLKVLLNCHWLLLKPCVGIENMFCLTWVHWLAFTVAFIAAPERSLLHLGVVTLSHFFKFVRKYTSYIKILREIKKITKISLVNTKARFILRQEAVKTLHFNQWEASKLRSLKNVTLYPKYSVQGTTGRENDVESTFVLHGIKNVQFLSPLEF